MCGRIIVRQKTVEGVIELKKRIDKTACFLALPILWLAILSATALSGCQKQQSFDWVYKTECSAVEQVGQVPKSFKEIIEKNQFHDAYAFGDRLLAVDTLLSENDQSVYVHVIKMMDLYGTELARYECLTGKAYKVTTLSATSDGGFIFVLGFTEYYEVEEEQWTSEHGFASRVIKCDRQGNLQFDTPFDLIEGRAFDYCIERNDGFFFFGTRETPETKKLGVGSPSDVYLTKLDHYGNVLKSKTIGGSSFDWLDAAENQGDNFKLSVRAQSQDGDFAESNSMYPVDWVVVVNEDFTIIKKSMETGRDSFDKKIGETDGIPIYMSSSLLNGFDAGRPSAYIDYGNFYLIVSENATGVYEKKPPTVSAAWCYWETVYSAYDNSGKLIFRTSVDSSPDYDSLVLPYTINPADS